MEGDESMSSSLVQLRIEDNLKNRATDLFCKLGIDLPTAIRMFLTRSVQVRGIPFAMQLPNENSDSDFAISAMKRMSDTALKNGNSEMTLDEINAEIDAVRHKQA